MHRRQHGSGPKNHSRSWIKKKGREKRDENSIYAALPYFSICYVYTFPRRGLTRFFSEIPFIFERDSRRYIAPDMLTRKKETRANSGHTRMPIAKASNVSACFVF